MDYKLDYDKINKFVQRAGKYSYQRRAITNVLPLPTREPERAKFTKGFTSVVGGVIRKIIGRNVHVESSETIIEDTVNLGSYKSEDAEELFTFYMNEQMEELNDGKMSNFQQIQQVPFAENASEQKGERDYVAFFFDTFIGEDVARIREALQNINDPNLISEIMSTLSLDEPKVLNHGKGAYKNLFPNLKEQFLQDIEALAQNESFMLDNISRLFVHYTFVVMSQIVIQTNKITRFEEANLAPVYYLLQWEKGGKWRDSYLQGYIMLRSEMKDFFAHEHVLNIVGMNTFTDERNLFYHDIVKVLDRAGQSAKQQFTESIYDWLNEVYKVKRNVEVAVYTSEKTLDDAFQDLLKAVKSDLSPEINSRYEKAFEALVSKFFRKHGGSLGTLLSLTQKQLLLLVAVSVRNGRIELKQLWLEFEQRGVWLDHDSKEEVVKLLDKLNYMEKKSDSGDAQYVKSIL